MSGPERSILDLMQSKGRKTPRILLRAVEGDAAVTAGGGAQRYVLVEKLARGGVGVVWRARDVDLGRHAAIKVLRESLRGSAEAIERFVEEAQISGQLQHPGIVPVYGLGVLEDYRPYFAMKLVKGRTLAELLRERSDPAERRRRFLSIFERICHTVAYAHARGVVHRDLKPRNIMIGAFGEVQVVDWGFAKVLAQGGIADERRRKGTPDLTVISTVRSEMDDTDSVSGSVMGTFAYMPPEQALGMIEQLDERCDVFSLGAILCEILTGAPPYTTERGDLLDQATNGKLEPAREALADCGAAAELVDLAQRCLSPTRTGRPRNAKAIALAMSNHLSELEERAHRTELGAIAARADAAEMRERVERARLEARAKRRARRQTVALAVAVLLVVVGAGGAFLWMRHDRVVRERRALAAIDEALREARFREGRAQWVEAIAAAQRSLDLAEAAAAGAHQREHAQAQLDRYREEKRRAEQDRAMAARLDELRSRWSNGDNHEQTDRDFAAAFRDYGHDVEKEEPDDVGARLRERRIAPELAAALDDWSLLRRMASRLKGTDWRRPLAVARVADPDDFRNRVRDAAAMRDSPALHAQARTDQLPARTLLLLGHSLTVAGEPRKGIDVLNRAVLRFPRDPWIHARLAFAYDSVKNRKASVRYYSAAVALRPKSAQMSMQLGDSLVLTKQSDSAIPVYRRAIELGPQIVRAYTGLCLALYDKKDFRGAADACDDAIRNAPPDPLPYHLKGTALQELREYEAAEEAYKKSVELGPDYAMLHRGLGSFYLHTRRYAEAAAALAKAAELSPNHFTTWYRLGSAHQAQGHLDKALAAYRKAQRLHPDHADVNLWIARMHWLQHEWAEALPWLERAHRLGSERSNWTYPTARFIQQAKAWQHLQPRLPAFLSGAERPRDATELRRIAELCYETKRHAAATRFWRELFEEHPAAEVTAARYDALCAAALAGTGRGADKAEDPAALRTLARTWLQKNLDELRAKPKADIQRRLSHWKRDGDLRGVRDDLAKLPADEQPAWRALWANVDALLAQSK